MIKSSERVLRRENEILTRNLGGRSLWKMTRSEGGFRWNFRKAPLTWKNPCAATEVTLHQLSPYIGKLKSSIAGDLISQYSKLGDLIVDPFAGAGTIPLEALIRNRSAFGSDISPYARILSLAKINPPQSLDEALERAENALIAAQKGVAVDLRRVPNWVRQFFHPETLREAIAFAAIAREPGNEFLMACFLGILHHQRPGFLSYPSSHLVPYLRSKNFPKSEYPELYERRSLRPRLLAKILRSYKRTVEFDSQLGKFREDSIGDVVLPKAFDAVITSPPYMNALDYGRDNRLRLWFVAPELVDTVDNGVTKREAEFEHAMKSLARKTERGLRKNGHCVIIVADALKGRAAHPSQVVMAIMNEHASSLRLKEIISDEIPDIRRARRECSGVKTELFLVFQKT